MNDYKNDKDGPNSNYMTGTQITNDILKQFNYFKSVKKDSNHAESRCNELGGENDPSVFKNVQRRVYDTINVLEALKVINKHKNNIILYNPDNEFFRDDDQRLISNLQQEEKFQKLKLMKLKKEEIAAKLAEAKARCQKL